MHGDGHGELGQVRVITVYAQDAIVRSAEEVGGVKGDGDGGADGGRREAIGGCYLQPAVAKKEDGVVNDVRQLAAPIVVISRIGGYAHYR